MLDMEAEGESSSPTWIAFADLMTGLLGAFVLLLVGVMATQLELASTPDQASRALQELWRKATQALGIRLKIRIAQWPEQLKASRNGKLMMWGVAWSATMPDGNEFLSLLYGPNKGQTNHARFDLPAYNQLYLRQRSEEHTSELQSH